MDSPPLFEDAWGGWFDWKTGTGPNGEFRIEPRRLDVIVFGVPVICLIWLGVVWFSGTEWQLEIVGTVTGIAASAGVTAMLAWHNRHQQQLGPFLAFDGRDLVLRHAYRVPVSELADFDILCRWEDEEENGYTQCNYLMLRNIHGQTFAVLGSWSRRSIRKVTAALEGQLSAVGWTARPAERVSSSTANSLT